MPINGRPESSVSTAAETALHARLSNLEARMDASDVTQTTRFDQLLGAIKALGAGAGHPIA